MVIVNYGGKQRYCHFSGGHCGTVFSQHLFPDQYHFACVLNIQLTISEASCGPLLRDKVRLNVLLAVNQSFAISDGDFGVILYLLIANTTANVTISHD